MRCCDGKPDALKTYIELMQDLIAVYDEGIEFTKELRVIARPEAIDIYIHIDSEDLRTSYPALMPGLGLY
jgi:hypothetical protein